MQRAILSVAILSCGLTAVSAARQPAIEPRIFAPGVISGPLDDASPAFTPSGKTVYFVRSDQSSTLMESHLKDGRWSTPRPAPFSGRWRDLDPAMAPDGSYLLFVSNRPVTPNGKRLDLVFEGKVYPTGMNIWRVSRQSDGWSKPARLPPVINTSAFTFAPSIAADNTLYYIGQTSPGQRGLLRARYRDGHYLQPQIVPIGDPNDWIRDPAIAPDQSFIVFSIIPAGSKQNPRLAISFRDGAGWSRPIDLGDEVNGAGGHAMGSQLGPDHRTLYFYSDRKLAAAGAEGWNDGKDNIWWVSLAPWLKPRHDRAGDARPN